MSCRGVGCIFSEMISGRPIFPGATNDDQLKLIFMTLGSPTPDSWPGLQALPHAATAALGSHEAKPLNTLLPRYEVPEAVQDTRTRLETVLI